MKEDEDGFIRWASDNDAGVKSNVKYAEESSESESELELDTNDAGFFEGEVPRSAWDLTEARDAARRDKLEFQTSLDEKIRKVKGRNNAVDDRDDGAEEEEDGVGEDEGDGETLVEKVVKSKRSKKLKKRKRAKELLGNDGVEEKVDDEVKSFDEFGLSRALLKALALLSWDTPTPIQSRVIPLILLARDICGSAVTGSGKTGAFLLPMIQRLISSGVHYRTTRAVILLPTRELAAQCHAVFSSLSKFTSIRAALIVGGLSSKAQETALRSNPEVVVATPGRLIDHVRNARGFALDDVEVFIMDEADRLLEMGFKDEIEEILSFMPKSGRQTLLFSATMNSNIKSLIKLSLKDPAVIKVDPMFNVAETLTQEFVKIRPSMEMSKDAVLLSLVTRSFKTKTIVFFRQKVDAHRFKILFALADLKASELHGNLTQGDRLASLEDFRDGNVDFMLCTDLAARGLDILNVVTVINYDMPSDIKEYVHRVGRTARAGADGRACSLVCTSENAETKLLRKLARSAKQKLSARTVPPASIGKWRARIDGWETQIKEILKEERKEKELRMAEMEVQKAENMLKHGEDIRQRPKRTWFQTSKEKDEAKGRARKDKGLEVSREDQHKDQRKRKREELVKKKKLRKVKAQEEEFLNQRRSARKVKRMRRS
eukprot:Plantae.Rhodophyta-Hildenbrandia_rubra.ctg2247.p1 GENE.Plantae.Rhodophyta-Hildenbrandia_rubra.ctg2247~~Plantae.Rhodophyta-Hildenbrandia_rubra.ctg2247.p1  ORF type:complete len:659 (-),score=162.08 Plantae.Rhodophyta-Hildenbrandia_rubra.ctg2247:1322-3298(-)